MSSSLTIVLESLRFFANHGWHELEALIETEFEVDLSVTFKAEKAIVDSIDETINYENLYTIIKSEMSIRQRLLETLVMNMADKIHLEYPNLEHISISIKKLNPPISNFMGGKVGVQYNKSFI